MVFDFACLFAQRQKPNQVFKKLKAQRQKLI